MYRAAGTICCLFALLSLAGAIFFPFFTTMVWLGKVITLFLMLCGAGGLGYIGVWFCITGGPIFLGGGREKRSIIQQFEDASLRFAPFGVAIFGGLIGLVILGKYSMPISGFVFGGAVSAMVTYVSCYCFFRLINPKRDRSRKSEFYRHFGQKDYKEIKEQVATKYAAEKIPSPSSDHLSKPNE